MRNIHRKILYLLFACFIGILLSSTPCLAGKIFTINKGVFQVGEFIEFKFKEPFINKISNHTYLIILRKGLITKSNIPYTLSTLISKSPGYLPICCPLITDQNYRLRAPNPPGQYELVLVREIKNQIRALDRVAFQVIGPQILEELRFVRYSDKCESPDCEDFVPIQGELHYGVVFFIEARYTSTGPGLPAEKTAQLEWEGFRPHSIPLKRKGNTSTYRSDPMMLTRTEEPGKEK